MSTQPASGVRDLPVASLHPWPGNPRTITAAAFERLKRSMAEDPAMLQARPLIALPDNTVIAGNMRLRAAVALGWQTIPTYVADLDEATARLWAVRDNTEVGEWEEQALAELLYELSQQQVDLELTGFDPAELERLLASVNGPDFDPASIDEQGRLDERAKVKCPECGHEFVPAP